MNRFITFYILIAFITSCNKIEILKGKTAVLEDFGTMEVACENRYSYYFRFDETTFFCNNIPDSIIKEYNNRNSEYYIIDYKIIDNTTCTTDNNKKVQFDIIELVSIIKKP